MRAEQNGLGLKTIAVIFFAIAAAFGAVFLAFEIFGQEKKPPEPDKPAAAPVGDKREPQPNPYDLSLFREADGRISYDGEPSPKHGIDVSSHQGEIDWAAVAADGIDFAMIRVGYRGYTEGATSLDEYFYENVAGALANGIEVGVYFFSQALDREEAVEEAELVLRAIEGLDISYPIVFDWEEIEGEARTDGMDPNVLTGAARAFCRTIKAAGYTPGVYFNQRQGYEHYNLIAIEEYTLWLAQYDTAPDFQYGFQMWQYSCTGRVDGIDTDVDLNLSFWEKEEQKRLHSGAFFAGLC